MSRTINSVHLRGFVGDYVLDNPTEGCPARFDIMTSDRLNTLEGEIISVHDWHTVVTSDVAFVKEHVKTGLLIDVKGRITTRKGGEGPRVEIDARKLEIIGESKRRRRQ